MKVHLHKDRPSSFGINRIEHYLIQYAPSCIRFVEGRNQADCVVQFVTGKLHHATRIAQENLEKGRQYAVIQIALKSTRNPDPQEWMDLWQKAKVVWSYYDLSAYVPRFYHAPLGVDPEVFYPIPQDRPYLICTTGIYYQAECLHEIWRATRILGKRIAHIGPSVSGWNHIDFYVGILDRTLNSVYNRSQYISGLRRKEGFEMPVVEALQGGARPILFDTPNYRQWFYDLAVFVPEEDSDALVVDLVRIMQKTPSVSRSDVLTARQRFDWKRIVSEFWERCIAP